MKVSVVVPVYGVEKYLNKCVGSLINQEYKDIEILLIDDGSPDKSGEICDEYDRLYPHIKVYHKDNGGLSSARNYGVEMATSEWITFVDSDDYVEPTYVSDLVKLIIDYEADLAITDLTMLTQEECAIKKEDRFTPFVVSGTEAFKKIYFEKLVSWSACGKLYKKEMLMRHPFPKRYYEEYSTAYIYACESDRVAIADYVNNYHYIRHENTITTQVFKNEHLAIFTACEEIISYMRSKNIDFPNGPEILYINAILNIFNRTKIEDKDIDNIFYKYNGMIRNSFMMLMFNKNIKFKLKYYVFLLATVPCIYRLHLKLLKKIRGR